MTGNETEEYLLTRLDYPGHADPARFAGLSGATAALIGGLVVNAFAGGAAALVIGVLTGLGIGALVYRHLDRRALARMAARLEERRADEEARVRHQIKERSGQAFEGEKGCKRANP